MSDKFNGFSEEEINKVCGVDNKPKANITNATTTTTKQAFRGHQHQGIRRVPEKWKTMEGAAKKQQVGKQMSTSAKITATKTKISNAADDTLQEVDLERGLSKSLEEALFYQPLQQSKINAKPLSNGAASSEAAAITTTADDSSILKLPAMDNNVSSTTINSSEMNDSSILSSAIKLEAVGFGAVSPDTLNLDSPFKGVSLKDFEVHRKMIEEQNKQKKELLYKAIEHHSQKTAAEARKIEEIKSELAKLDNDLAVDVAILRKQIEHACIHFSNIEKQYVKIEAQFLKSKIELHNAAEKKELLTEHLCTVIAHNEDRKAQKLSELMEKVGLTPTGEYQAISTNNAEH